MTLLSRVFRKTEWEITIASDDYELSGLSRKQFQRFVSEYIEHGIERDDFEAFAKRWIEPDANERLVKNDTVIYPRGASDD
jgi:hypothetical protein